MHSKHIIHNGHATLESMGQAIWFNQWTYELFREYIEGTILEIGSGIGNFTKKLSLHRDVYAIDIEREYFPIIRKKLKKSGVRIGFGDIETGTYFFGKKTFDTLICLNTLEHIKHDVKALSNMHSLLRPNKHLILLVPAHQFLYSTLDKAIGHHRRYSFSNLIVKLKRAGFRILIKRRINMLGAVGWFISGKILKEDTIAERKILLFDRIAKYILPIERHIDIPFGTSLLIIATKPALSIKRRTKTAKRR